MKGFENIAWNCKNPVPITQDEFSKNIAEYQTVILGRNTWNPEIIAFDEPVVDISYSYWAKDNNLVFDDERGVGMFSEMEIPTSFNDWKEIEVAYRIFADNQLNFTALELFWKICSRLKQRDLMDHCYFEGFSPIKNNDSRKVKLFFIRFGS